MTLPLTVDDEAKPKARPRKPARAPDCACASPAGGACRGAWDVVLIGCGSEKAAEPTAAADLYTGSLYSAHRRILTHVSAWPPTAILSAQHGWLAPEQVIEPYQRHVDDLTAEERTAWADRIASRIYAQHSEKPVVLVLAGGAYIDPWTDVLSEDDLGLGAIDPAWGRAPIGAGAIIIDDPLRGLEVGERLAFAADLIAAGPKLFRKSPRCALHAFMRDYRTRLEERRADRRVAAARARKSTAAQLDMFAGTGATA